MSIKQRVIQLNIILGSPTRKSTKPSRKNAVPSAIQDNPDACRVYGLLTSKRISSEEARKFSVWCARESLRKFEATSDSVSYVCSAFDKYIDGEATIDHVRGVWNIKSHELVHGCGSVAKLSRNPKWGSALCVSITAATGHAKSFKRKGGAWACAFISAHHARTVRWDRQCEKIIDILSSN